VKIVYVKAANIRNNFSGAMVTPVLLRIPNGVSMGTRIPDVISLLFQLALIKIVN
jgi:hypothetical protein